MKRGLVPHQSVLVRHRSKVTGPPIKSDGYQVEVGCDRDGYQKVEVGYSVLSVPKDSNWRL